MLLSFLVSMVLTLLVMTIEVKLTPERNAAGEHDLREKSIGIYFMLALFSSFIILPIYFYIRRGGKGAWLGLALACAVALAAGFVTVLVQRAVL